MEAQICANNTVQEVVSSEQLLIKRAASEPEAFAELYRLHSKRIAGYLYRRTGDAHVAEDLLSEVFLATMRGLHGFKDRGHGIEPWLYRIATNAVNKWSRRNRRRFASLRSAANVADSSHATMNGYSTNHADSTLRAFQQISTKYQSVLALHHVEGLTVEQVATVLGCRVGTVKSRLSKARAALKTKLAKENSE